MDLGKYLINNRTNEMKNKKKQSAKALNAEEMLTSGKYKSTYKKPIKGKPVKVTKKVTVKPAGKYTGGAAQKKYDNMSAAELQKIIDRGKKK